MRRKRGIPFVECFRRFVGTDLPERLDDGDAIRGLFETGDQRGQAARVLHPPQQRQHLDRRLRGLNHFEGVVQRQGLARRIPTGDEQRERQLAVFLVGICESRLQRRQQLGMTDLDQRGECRRTQIGPWVGDIFVQRLRPDRAGMPRQDLHDLLLRLGRFVGENRQQSFVGRRESRRGQAGDRARSRRLLPGPNQLEQSGNAVRLAKVAE